MQFWTLQKQASLGCFQHFGGGTNSDANKWFYNAIKETYKSMNKYGNIGHMIQSFRDFPVKQKLGQWVHGSFQNNGELLYDVIQTQYNSNLEYPMTADYPSQGAMAISCHICRNQQIFSVMQTPKIEMNTSILIVPPTTLARV